MSEINWAKTYLIQHTVMCTNLYEEYTWVEGICAFIDPEKMSKDKLMEFSDEMEEEFRKGRTTHWRHNRSPLTTIAILEDGKMHILYSDMTSKTIVNKIGDVLDTSDAVNKWDITNCCEIYRDDFPDSDSENSDDNSNDSSS